MSRKLALILGVIFVTAFLGGCSCKHKWTSATCKSLACCELCGEETGTFAECIENEGEFEIEPTLSEVGKKVIKCTVCNKEIRSEEIHKKALAEKGSFNFSAKEFGDFFKLNLKLLDDGAYAAVMTVGNGPGETCYVLIMENSDKKVIKICIKSDDEVGAAALSVFFGTRAFGMDKDTAAKGLISTGRYKENNILIETLDEYMVEISPNI
ncbi:MAG: hypothetical protein E7390_00865 [Ruminococcaceae bacterium]|nr:hypothetical protein [Oscillospiraceae bacterium]